MEHIIRELLNIPLFFKIIFGLFIYTVVVMIVFWIQFDKYIKRILSLDDAKKERTIGALKRLARMHRLLFSFSPLYFISIYMIYKFDHHSDANYGIAMMIMTYLIERAIYFFTKKTLNKLNQ
jgi:hypothetical protein